MANLDSQFTGENPVTAGPTLIFGCAMDHFRSWPFPKPMITRLARFIVLAAVLAASPGLAQDRPVHASNGMVASQEARATRVGVEVLQQGGNAVDAAVAVGF